MCISGQVSCAHWRGSHSDCKRLMAFPCSLPLQGSFCASQAVARGWPLPDSVEHQPPSPPDPHRGPPKPGGSGAGCRGREMRPSWAGSKPCLPPLTSPPPPPRLPAMAQRACASESSPSRSNPEPSCWMAGAGPSTASGTSGSPCRAARFGPVTTASPCTTVACPGQEVSRVVRGTGWG